MSRTKSAKMEVSEFAGFGLLQNPSNPEPHWQGHRERLRGKLLARGAGALDDYEILEVLLMAFIPRRDVKPIAKALEKKFKSREAISSWTALVEYVRREIQ